MYQREFFQLVFDFASMLSERHEVPFNHAIFKYTPYYVRIIGHSDSHHPNEKNPVWQGIVDNIPKDRSKIVDYFYEKYLEAEKKKPLKNETNAEPCFHTYYHKRKSKYQLHLDPNDPKGILGKDRIDVRKKELENMFGQILKHGNTQTILYVTTWLLGIEAFNRLFPLKFSEKAFDLDNDWGMYDNTHWGQFLTRDKRLKDGVVMDFKKKFEEEHSDNFNLYLPHPARYSELPLKDFFEYFKIV